MILFFGLVHNANIEQNNNSIYFNVCFKSQCMECVKKTGVEVIDNKVHCKILQIPALFIVLISLLIKFYI
jgi:hypothetical protein